MFFISQVSLLIYLQQSQINLTMYKYTYQLSDSYRQNPILIQHSGGEYRQHLQDHTKMNFQNLIQRPRITSEPFTIKQLNPIAKNHHNHNLQKTKINLSVRKFNYQINNARLEEPQKYHFITQNTMKTTQKKSNTYQGNQENVLKSRLIKLNDLGERHSQALRQAQIQNKLKEITNKYKEKQTQTDQKLGNTYYNYKDERIKGKLQSSFKAAQNLKQNLQQPQMHLRNNRLKNDYSFNILPQTVIQQNNQKGQKSTLKDSFQNHQDFRANNPFQLAAQADSDINRNKVKRLITNHLETAKLDKERFSQHPVSQKEIKHRSFDRRNPLNNYQLQNIKNQSEKGRLAVQKLSSLQQKIKASVKPYLNI